MHKGDRIFVDGMSTVKMTNGVVLMDFYNNRNNGGADIQESCGEIVMSHALLNAMEHYGDMAQYNVAFTVCKSGEALDVKSDEVTAERIRLKELGYTVYYTEYTTETPNVYHYKIGFHGTLDEVRNFPVNPDYGYIITLCDE